MPGATSWRQGASWRVVAFAHIRGGLPPKILARPWTKWQATCHTLPMANQHKFKQRVIRGVPDEDWADFDVLAQAAGTDRSAILRDFIAWYVHRPKAHRPARPDADAPSA